VLGGPQDTPQQIALIADFRYSRSALARSLFFSVSQKTGDSGFQITTPLIDGKQLMAGGADKNSSDGR
jgi:hypothetical protein